MPTTSTDENDPPPIERDMEAIGGLIEEYGWSGVLDMLAACETNSGYSLVAEQIERINGGIRWPQLRHEKCGKCSGSGLLTDENGGQQDDVCPHCGGDCDEPR